jgi:hypothetical protein
MVGGPERLSNLAADDAGDANQQLHPLVLAQYVSPVDRPAQAQPAPGDDDVPWRAHYGQQGFRVGQQPSGKIKTDPGPEAAPPAPGATAANPPPRGRFAPAPNVLGQGDPNPNRNGKPDPNEPVWAQPGAAVRPVQVAKDGPAAPISEDEFWKRQDQLIRPTGRNLGVVTNDPFYAMAAGAGAGWLGDVSSMGLSNRADSILHKRARLVAEGSTAEPTGSQQWAQNWRQNWDRTGRVDLEYQKSLASIESRSNDLRTTASHMDGLVNDWGGRVQGSPPTQRLADYLGELNKERATQRLTPLQIGDNEFSQVLAQRHKDALEAVSKIGQERSIMTEFKAKEVASARWQYGQGGALRGAGLVGAGLLIDNYADRLFNPDSDHKTGLTSFYGAVSIPLALAWNPLAGPTAGKTRTMIGFLATTATLTGIGMAIGRAIDSPALKDTLASRQWNPNMMDIASMGFTAGLPAPSTGNRLALAAGGWFEARSMGADNIFKKMGWSAVGAAVSLPFIDKGIKGPAIAFHLVAFGLSVADGLINPQPNYKQANNDAWAALKEDQTKRTAASLNKSIDDFAQAAIKNDIDKDGPLFEYFDKWRSKATPFPEPDKGGDLLRDRGIVILGTALGEARLANGSARLQPDYHLEYIPGLNGLNLDFGGYAAAYLENAKRSADDAAKESQRLAAKDGKTVDQSELDGLKAAKDRIDKNLDKIYGPTTTHNIPQAFNVLTDYVKNNTEKSYVDWMNHIRDNRIVPLMSQANYDKDPVAKKLVAKALRDEALLFMATANKIHVYGHDDVSANLLLTNANTNPATYLRMANHLDPNNPDLPQYMDIYNKLANATRLGAVESLQNDNSANAWMVDQNQILNPGGRQ